MRRIGGVRIINPNPGRDQRRHVHAGDLLPERSGRGLGARSSRQVDQHLHSRRRSAAAKDAFHLGINIILYAMTENYKEDLIHVPFIRKRLTR